MKIHICPLQGILIGFLLHTCILTSGQNPDWNTAGNQITFQEWFGADNQSTIPVQFQHQANIGANSRFEWHTNNGTLAERMRLTSDGELGLNIPPIALLHVHRPSSGEDLGFADLRFTTGLTGATANDGLEIGVQDFGFTNFISYLSFRENGPIHIRQNNSLRMHINNGTWTDPLGVVDNDVTRILIPITNTAALTPFSALHVGDIAMLGAAVQRPWMNAGTSYSSLNLDLMYTGLYENAGDITDAAVAWGCNLPGIAGGPDNLRFIFLGPQDGSGTIPASIPGQEVGRFSPVGNFGVGNFFTNGLNEQPSQRIDIDGTARLRNVPANLSDAVITGVEVNGTGDYILNHLAFNGQADSYLSGNGTWQVLATDLLCEWNEGVNPDDLVMGFTTACHEGNVGIGLDDPFAKLEVFMDGTGLAQHVIAQQIDLIGTNNGGTNESRGLDIDVTGDNEEPDYAHTGVKIDVEYSRKIRGADIATTAGLETGENFGVKSVAAGQSTVTNCLNVGVWGEAKNAPSGGRDIGVSGVATDGANANIGIHGRVSSGQTSYAGYFEGNVHIVGNLTATGSGTFNTSDATLKSDISDLENGLEVILQLSPKTYQFTVDQFPQLGLPTGQHAGVLAQDLEIVLPELVKEVTMLGQISEDGDLLNENVSFKAVNYTELIPYLIGAIKQQQNQIESLQISLDACCSSDTKSQTTGEGDIRSVKLESSPSPILYQNTPNPHQGQTVIRYFLPENSGAAEMHFFDTQGQVIRIEVLQQTGMGQINVDASDLANGVYTYALLINGKVIDMKKMVKE